MTWGGRRERVIDHEAERREAQAAARARLEAEGWLRVERARRPERVWETATEVRLHRRFAFYGL